MAASMLVYDSDCGFCTTTARWIETRLKPGPSIEPWQSLDLADLGLTETEVTAAAYWVEPGGRLYRGHLAIGRALIAAGRPYLWAGRLIAHRPFSWLAAPVYSWIARNRYRMPGSTDACRLPSN